MSAVSRADAEEPVGGQSMIVGGATLQPIGHYEFCKQHQAECRTGGQATGAPQVTDFGWDIVRDVNLSVNDAIVPRTDREMHGVEERWSYPQTEGDCEDYVLLKRKMLQERGFDVQDLLITVVRKRDGEGHAVLTLRTAQGDYILDNLTNSVKSWRDTPYVYLKRQSSHHAGRWVSIENGNDILVGALD